ncbi:hypothetical protein [Nannocystis punicea]|uniref:Uncharacterized protein n=1 Tax=Nannocystis punicea TaxID=2995304 RepID=A0ABY7H701_9BACT|nr:hypothetical protein [Nannocystis poenicansa]WAS94855.1 hypothetical protein O0S08_01730 [Nannocystis poenicansa]
MRHLYKCGDGVCYCFQWGLDARLNALGFPRSDEPESEARDDVARARHREEFIYLFSGRWELREEAAALPQGALESLQEQALKDTQKYWSSLDPATWATRILSVSTVKGRLSAVVEVWDGERQLHKAYVDFPPRPPRRRPSWYL